MIDVLCVCVGLIGAGEGRGADEGFMALRRVSDQVKEERRRGWKRGARPAASRVRLPRSFIKHGSSVRGRLSADSAGFVSVPFQEKKALRLQPYYKSLPKDFARELY